MPVLKEIKTIYIYIYIFFPIFNSLYENSITLISKSDEEGNYRPLLLLSIYAKILSVSC